MMETQVRFHGFDPAAAIIEVGPREGEMHIRTDDILETIAAHRGELALVLWGGVQYYTGQLFDMQTITTAAHRAGAVAGFDLAHAVGNVELKLHEWGADFAAWCHYKYLNGGPGTVGGAFIHEKHHGNPELMRFGGWWGYSKPERFKMKKGFDPAPTAEGWQLSTPSLILYAALHASLQIFDEAGMPAVARKGAQLSDYLMYLLKDEELQIVTPNDKGCQVSLRIAHNGRKIFDQLASQGIFADWREPAVIRVAAVPLYNTFTEVYEFAQVLKKLLRSA
jgi:kynureninase